MKLHVPTRSNELLKFLRNFFEKVMTPGKAGGLGKP